MKNYRHSDVVDNIIMLVGIIIILVLFMLAIMAAHIISYQSGYSDGKHYVMSSIELQKCGTLKKNFTKGG